MPENKKEQTFDHQVSDKTHDETDSSSQCVMSMTPPKAPRLKPVKTHLDLESQLIRLLMTQ